MQCQGMLVQAPDAVDVFHLAGWCFALPAFIMRLPWAVFESALWSFIVYWCAAVLCPTI